MEDVSENKPEDVDGQINVCTIAAAHKTVESRAFIAEQYSKNKESEEWDTEEKKVVKVNGLGEITIEESVECALISARWAG